MKLRFVYLTVLSILLFTFSASISAKPAATVSVDDSWISVRSKNFFLIGDAKEKDIREVATKLEQFRETFRLLFPDIQFTQAIGTNVVVFKNEKSYKPFLPKRGDGKADTGIAGYFQAGEDVNYITLSTEGKSEDTYGTIFHEYVHFLLNTNFGESEIPPWFNEGLAEYYQTFKIEDNKKVSLGIFQENHLYLLQQSKLIPLKDFFAIDNYSLHQNGNHSRSIFYAQAWALMHYLIQSNQGVSLNNFLALMMSDVEPEKAFKQAFQMDYTEMEKALKKYVNQRRYNYTISTFNKELTFASELKVAPLAEAEANAYLGDLLYHTREYVDAEVYLQKALAIDAEQSMANTTLGLVRMKQRKFSEAKSYLQKAVAGNRLNHFAHYNYAYVLSRESMDESGWVTGYPAETATIMRKSLLEAIKLNPSFTDSYRLLAFINLVNNENLEEAVTLLKKALAFQPGNEDYQITIAHIYLRQQKFDEAEKIASKIAKTASESVMRMQAENLLSNINDFRKHQAEIEEYKRTSKESEALPPNAKMKSSLTAEEIAQIERDNQIYAFNQQLKQPAAGEKRIIGQTQKIECVSGGVKYTIKTDEGILTLKSKDFQNLKLQAYTEEAYEVMVGCDAKISFRTVYFYQPAADPKMKTSGNLSSMTFVPEFFVLKTADELAKMQQIIIVDDAERKQALIDQLKTSLRKPKADEKQALGIVEKIECVKQEMIFRVKISGQDFTLKTDSPNDVSINIFTREAAGMQFGCGVKLPPVKASITYRPDGKSSTKGEIIALEFVPDEFEF